MSAERKDFIVVSPKEYEEVGDILRYFAPVIVREYTLLERVENGMESLRQWYCDRCKRPLLSSLEDQPSGN